LSKEIILKTKQHISENFIQFFNAIALFQQNKPGIKHVKKLLESVSNIFMLLPKIEYAAIYSLKTKSFLLERYFTEPISNKIKNDFDNLTSKGHISKVLQTEEILTTFSDDEKNENIIIVPMLTYDGIIGLLLLSTKINYSVYDSRLIDLINLFTSYFSSAISELIVLEREAKLNSLFDQMLASRTLKIQHKQTILGNKLNLMTSNLLMALPHEIRTPINQILGISNFLKNYFSEDVVKNADTLDMLSDISVATSRLRRLLENYLFYANLVILANDINELTIKQGKTMETCEPFIYETVFNFAHVNERQDDIQLDLVDAHICIDEMYFIKIIEELMDNAIKFSHKGDKIIVNSFTIRDKYYIMIKDYGIGIDDNQIEYIGPYVQFERNLNEQQGSGFGLSIVAKILDIFHGDFKITGKKDEYAEVIIGINIFKEAQF